MTRPRGLTAAQTTHLIAILERAIARHQQREKDGEAQAAAAKYDSAGYHAAIYDQIWHAGASCALDLALRDLKDQAGRE